MENAHLFVSSVHPGSQGPAGDRPLSRVTGHGAGIFRTRVHARWWRPEDQMRHVDDGHCRPLARL